MSNLFATAQDSVDAQAEMFRRAEREEGLSIRAINRRFNPLKVSTMEGWRDGAQMPAWAVGALGAAGVPDHLLSLITDPFGRVVTTEPEGEGDLDTAASDALEFAGEVQKARSPKSPGGLAIVPQEKALIEPKRQRACASMRRAAA
jgi:hypothetical protein